jgi:hypothetical protein
MRTVTPVLIALLAGCGDNIKIKPDASNGRITTGTHLIQRPSVVGGVTTSGDLAFYDYDADGHSVAKVIPLAGGDETTIATSMGTGKPDIRFAVAGDVVFAWTDRGNRIATLTMWSRSAGVVSIGANVRPGRAAATVDGSSIVYERDVTATTVNVAVGPLAGAQAIVESSNSADSTCWQTTDLASVGNRLLVRACPASSTAFTLRSYSPDGSASATLSTSTTTAWYGRDRVVFLDGTGTVASTLGDGTGSATLATGAAELAVSDDGASVFTRGNDGSISSIASDGSGAARPLVSSGAMVLGAVAPDRTTALYATTLDDRGTGYVQPYTDVKTTSGLTLVPGATSCPRCLADSFTSDSHYALVIDPIDNSQAVDGEGPIHVFDLATGASVTSFGSLIFDAISIDGSRFLFLDAVRDSTQVTGWLYGLTSRGVLADDAATVIATGVETLAIDDARTTVVYSLSASDSDDAAGIWVAAL